jgi:hypothetical protein
MFENLFSIKSVSASVLLLGLGFFGGVYWNSGPTPKETLLSLSSSAEKSGSLVTESESRSIASAAVSSGSVGTSSTQSKSADKLSLSGQRIQYKFSPDFFKSKKMPSSTGNAVPYSFEDSNDGDENPFLEAQIEVSKRILEMASTADSFEDLTE